ncbi:type ISP restriction/modification enzyme [Limibacter armeniacum]|uniref:type ISP restriction/modification enzyme n=1 Tax=Limibacter armeniacum TaxID=466084 RepID=UPI002FE5EB95
MAKPLAQSIKPNVVLTMSDKVQEQVSKIRGTILDVKSMLYNQLVLGKERLAEANCQHKNLIQTLKEVLFCKLDNADLCQLVVDHIVMGEVIKLSQGFEILSNDSLYLKMDQLTATLIDSESQSVQLKAVTTSITDLQLEGYTDDELKTILQTALVKEKTSALPPYFNGLMQLIYHKHFGKLPDDDLHYLYPSYSMPAFLTHKAEKATFICHDLIVYYWTLCHQPNNKACFGNSLSFYNFGPDGDQQSLFWGGDNHLEKLSEVLSKPVHVLLGTLNDLNAGMRPSHPELVKDVKKNFGERIARSPLPSWLQWAKQKLHGEGLLIVRGDISLAGQQEYLELRKLAEKLCAAVYVQADKETNMVLYAFVFEKKKSKSKVFFSKSHMEDFEAVPNDSSDWCTLLSFDFENFLPLISEKENSIFHQKAEGLQVPNKGWLLDFDKTVLEKKVQLFINEKSLKSKANSKSTLPLNNKPPMVFRKENIKRVTVSPFVRKWAYLDTESGQSQYNELSNQPMLAWIAEKGKVSALITDGLTLSDYFERGQQGSFFPLYRSVEGEKQEWNITSWAFKQFQKYYGAPLQGSASSQISPQHIEWLKDQTSKLGVFSQQMPVLHKFTRQMVALLDSEPTDAFAEQLNTLIGHYFDKLKMLMKGAKERRKLFEGILNILSSMEAYLYDADSTRIEAKQKLEAITHENIFYYVIAVLHHPDYQRIFAKELVAVVPRIPMLKDFWKWAEAGKSLAALYLNKEGVRPYPLQIEDDIKGVRGFRIKDKKVQLGDGVLISELPEEVWDFNFGASNMLENLLLQYRERKPLDKSLATFYQDKLTEQRRHEIVRSVQQVCQLQQEIKKILPVTLFEEKNKTITLKRRKVG